MHSQKGSHENFYQEEMEDTMHPDPAAKMAMGHSQGKTANNFYPHSIQDMQRRPGSAQVIPRPRVVSSFCLTPLEK